MTSLNWKLILSLFVLSTCFEYGHSEPYQGITNATATGSFKSTVYTYHPEPKSFYGALQHCATRIGGLLASAADAQEVNFIASLISKVSSNNNVVWVGAFQMSGEIVTTPDNPIFVWVNSENKIDSSLWAAGHPTGTYADPKRCAFLKRESTIAVWQLVDDSCNARAPFLCAKSNQK